MEAIQSGRQLMRFARRGKSNVETHFYASQEPVVPVPYKLNLDDAPSMSLKAIAHFSAFLSLINIGGFANVYNAHPSTASQRYFKDYSYARCKQILERAQSTSSTRA